MRSHRTVALALLVWLALGTASAQQPSSGSLILEQGGARTTLSATASTRYPHHHGGITPSECEAASQTLSIHARANAGDLRAITIQVTSPGPRALRARIEATPPDASERSLDDGTCAFAELFVQTAAGQIRASAGDVRLTRWDATTAEGSFVAIFSDRRAPRGSLRGTFSARYRQPPPEPHREALPIP